MRIPSDLITKNKYTAGGEFIYSDTYEDYQGYYYILNNKFFEGKNFKANARQLIKINSDKVNKLKLNKATSVFAGLSNIKIPNINFSSFINKDKNLTRYFAKKINNNPILIKEIDEDTFKKIQSDPIYQTTYIGFYQGANQTSDQAYAQMVGLKEFVEG